jgi:prevent-host-death family protein
MDQITVHNRNMRISVTEAKGQLTKLVLPAEAGDEVILTRHGHPAVRLVPVRKTLSAEERRAILDKVMAEGAAKATPGPSAARSQDLLYDDNGLNDFARTDLESVL